MNMNGCMKNILAVYDQATPAEQSTGMEWYGNAHDAAAKLHADIRVGASVVAALSPGLRWERNVEAARRVFAGESLDGLGMRWYAGVRKAERIIAGESPERVLGGNKVRSFFRCIESPLNPLFVCIDGHAYSITKGKYNPLDTIPNISDRKYSHIAARYCNAAYHAGILPLQMQAVTWVVWRRLHVKEVVR